MSKTLYVDLNHASASDSNLGSAEAPFLTIQAAVDAASPGDTVLVMPGIYREAVTIAKSGLSKERPFTLMAARPGETIIRGSDVVTQWQPAGIGLYRCHWPHQVTILKEKQFGFCAHPDQVFVDGQLLEHVAKREELTPNSFWIDRPNQFVYIRLADGDAPLARLVEVSRRARWVTVKKQVPVPSADLGATQKQYDERLDDLRFVRLAGLRMEHSTASVQEYGCCFFVNDGLVEDCEFAYAGAGSGMKFRGDRNLIRRCRFHHNGQMGFGGGHGRESIFEDNYVYQNNTRPIRGWESGVGKITYAIEYIFRRNVFADHAYGPGLWLDIDNYRCVVEQNLFSNIDSNAIMVEISYDNIVRNNIIVNTNCHPAWSHSRCGILVQLCCKTKVYNNLIYGTDGYGVHLRWHVRKRDIHPFPDISPEQAVKEYGIDFSDWMGAADQYPLDDNEIYNNILINNSMGAIRIDFQNDFVHNNRSDHNIFWDYVMEHPMDGGHRLLEWQRMTGLDEHSIYIRGRANIPPMVTNVDQLDFQLVDGCPAIGAGTPVEGLTDDFLGNSRPAGKMPDIGPYQKS